MAGLLKKCIVTLLALVTCIGAFGQQLEVVAPRSVPVGVPFRVEYTIEVQGEKFNAPDFTGFNVIAGPSRSSGQSIQIINGNMTQTVSTLYTYVLQAQQEGTATLPAASIVAGGKTYTSKPVPIEVTSGGQAQQGGQQSQGNRNMPSGQTGQESGAVADDDVMIRMFVNKTSVYKGEPVKVTLKLYNRTTLVDFENTKFPSFNGFWSQELNIDHYVTQRETYGNKVYNTQVMREYLVYPQQTGVLNIDPITTEAVIEIMERRRTGSIFDDLMGGISESRRVKKKVASQSIAITVKDFPGTAPEGFNGAVGNFTMTTEAPTGQLNVNSAATYSLKITGTGNLPLITAPEVTMPSSFEKYDPKTTESLRKTTGGISGYRQFDYPFIARAEGDFNISPLLFTYFNPESGEYVTLRSDAVPMHILPDTTGGRTSSAGGMVTGLTKEELKLLGRDIRFIKLGDAGLRPKGQVFVCSTPYFVIAGLLLAAFVFLLVWLRKRIEQMRDAALMRGKKANKVVLGRLRTAEQYMKENNTRRFHDEMLKALWGYMSDKLNIPVANLTKENVREELGRRNIPAELVGRYIDLISECESAQYSPAESIPMQDAYKTAVDVISKFESYIKR